MSERNAEVDRVTLEMLYNLGDPQAEIGLHYFREAQALRRQLSEKEQALEQAREVVGSLKAFHKNLCERFGYTHDPVDWQRDLVSLEEWIAGQLSQAQAVVEAARKVEPIFSIFLDGDRLVLGTIGIGGNAAEKVQQFKAILEQYRAESCPTAEREGEK